MSSRLRDACSFLLMTPFVLAEISAKKPIPPYSRHERLTVDGALPIINIRDSAECGIKIRRNDRRAER